MLLTKTRASHNKHDGFGREHPTFGDETISFASYCFQFFSRVNIEQQECCVNLCDFSGFVWTFYALSEFSLNLCAWYKFELHAHAPVHINWLKNQICVLGCMLRSHARNENEFQTPRHHRSAADIEIHGLNSSKSKTCLKFMKLGMLSWNGINMLW